MPIVRGAPKGFPPSGKVYDYFRPRKRKGIYLLLEDNKIDMKGNGWVVIYKRHKFVNSTEFNNTLEMRIRVPLFTFPEKVLKN
jgi:hypothetical protein